MPRPHILLTLLLATALRFWRIDHQSFWNDEGNSARIAERSVDKILAGAAADIHPPGYYLMLAGWRALAGQSELALRGFSVFAGVALVALVFRVGRDMFGEVSGFAAAAIAAVHPFLIYYAQEARMYALAATLGAGLFWIAYRVTHRSAFPTRLGGAYVLVAAAGLYTHYSFGFILIAVNLAALAVIARRGRPLLARWTLLQAGALLLFLPWLPIAWRQVTTWPAARAYLPFLTATAEAWRWLAYGPTAQTADVAPGLVALAILAVAGLLGRRSIAASLWLLVPAGLTLAFGLFSEAFAKFLLVAAPAVCLLAGHGIQTGWQQFRRDLAAQNWPGALLLAGALAALTAGWLRFDLAALRNLFDNPAYFRADYRTMAADIEAVARPDDAILLNAPNQWEVFTYYHPDDSNVFPVARTRPLDAPAQIAELEGIAATHDRLFVVYWGDAQSDPGRVVESWLNEHTYKAYDRWYRDVRLSAYAAPKAAARPQVRTEAAFGESILLEGYALNATTFSPGDILQLALFWRAQSPISERYKVFVHVYADPAAPPVAQQDGEPGGGLALTTTWQPGELIQDNHGVFLPLDLSGGEYQLAIGLYDVDDGGRLPIEQNGLPVGDSLPMGTIDVVRR